MTTLRGSASLGSLALGRAPLCFLRPSAALLPLHEKPGCKSNLKSFRTMLLEWHFRCL